MVIVLESKLKKALLSTVSYCQFGQILYIQTTSEFDADQLGIGQFFLPGAYMSRQLQKSFMLLQKQSIFGVA